MGNRSRLQPRARRGGGLGTHNLVVSKADGPVRSSVVGHRVLPFDPWGGLVQARATLLTSWSVSAC
jgi:hypothetical protein